MTSREEVRLGSYFTTAVPAPSTIPGTCVPWHEGSQLQEEVQKITTAGAIEGR